MKKEELELENLKLELEKKRLDIEKSKHDMERDRKKEARDIQHLCIVYFLAFITFFTFILGHVTIK